MSSGKVALAAMAAAFLLACGEAPTAQRITGVADRPAPRADFVNGPATLPNIVRNGSSFGRAWQDPALGVSIFVNWPCPPGFDTAPISQQEVGELLEALHRLSVARDVSVRLFSGFPSATDACTTPALAEGVGRYTFIQNNAWRQGTQPFPQASTLLETVRADVVLADGRNAKLSAQSRALIKDGELIPLVSSVQLVLQP